MNTKAKGVKRGVIVRVHARHDVFDVICGWFSIVHVRDGPISIAIIIDIEKVTSYRHASVPPRVHGTEWSSGQNPGFTALCLLVRLPLMALSVMLFACEQRTCTLWGSNPRPRDNLTSALPFSHPGC